MACDVLQDVMEYDGDGTVQVFEDDEGTKEYRESIATVDAAAALDRILTWILDDEEQCTALGGILMSIKHRPPGWKGMCELLVNGVIAARGEQAS